jgi:hypothetical protein
MIFDLILNEEKFSELYEEFEKMFERDVSSDSSTTTPNYLGQLSSEILEKLPAEIAELCSELNIASKNELKYACAFLIRRIIPLSIYIKFKKENILEKIRDPQRNNEFYGTKKLLELAKNEKYLESRTERELQQLRFITDTSQHNYNFKIENHEIIDSFPKVKVFLSDLYI